MWRMAIGLVALLSLLPVLAAPASGQPGIQITTALQTTTTIAGQPIEFPHFRNQVTALLVEFAPGGVNPRHQHPVPNTVYVLEGTVTIEVEGQAPRTFGPGQAFVEPINVWHSAFNRGTTTHKAIAVFAGEQGKPNFVRPPGLNPEGVKSTTVFQGTTDLVGRLILFPLFQNEIFTGVAEFVPGADNGRHLHPVPQFVYVLQGAITNVTDGHGEKVVRAGEAFIEPVNAWTRTINRGTIPSKHMAVFFTETGVPRTVRP